MKNCCETEIAFLGEEKSIPSPQLALAFSSFTSKITIDDYLRDLEWNLLPISVDIRLPSRVDKLLSLAPRRDDTRIGKSN